MHPTKVAERAKAYYAANNENMPANWQNPSENRTQHWSNYIVFTCKILLRESVCILPICDADTICVTATNPSRKTTTFPHIFLQICACFPVRGRHDDMPRKSFLSFGHAVGRWHVGRCVQQPGEEREGRVFKANPGHPRQVGLGAQCSSVLPKGSRCL